MDYLASSLCSIDIFQFNLWKWLYWNIFLLDRAVNGNDHLIILGKYKNLIGNTDLESTIYFNVSLTNFYTNEYFIVIHYCPPFWSSCISLTECSDECYVGPNCGGSQYLDFNSTTEFMQKFRIMYLMCKQLILFDQWNLFVQSIYIFIRRNKYCEYCYGDSQYNCLTCVRDYYNRDTNRHQCLCLPGYYDDGINLPCLPICGDQQQQKVRTVMMEIITHLIVAIMVNLVVILHVIYAQMEIFINVKVDFMFRIMTVALFVRQFNHITPIMQLRIKKLSQLLIECYPNCIDYHFGRCVKCNEDKGWYIQIDGTCNSICGDGIVANLSEMCDDGMVTHKMDAINVNFLVINFIILVSTPSVQIVKKAIDQQQTNVFHYVMMNYQCILNNVKIIINYLLMVVSISNFNVEFIALIVNMVSVNNAMKKVVGICNKIDFVKVFVETIQQLLKKQSVMNTILIVFVNNVKLDVISIVYNVKMEFVCLVFKVINGNFHYNNVLEFVEIVYQQIKKRFVKMELTDQMMDAISVNQIVNNHVLYVLKLDAQNVKLKDGN